MSTELCRSFQLLASLTWHRLQSAQATGLAWSEETNTETILMALRERHAAEVKVVSFKKLDEALNGADWEWWIGSPGSWLGMRVQAKRISLPSEVFSRLQTYKAKGQPKSQILTLIEAASRERLNPVYCLYVFSERWPRMGTWPSFPFSGPGGISPLGCLIGHAQAVARTRSNALARLAPSLLPWHLLVCACNSAMLRFSAAHQAYDALRESLGSTSGEYKSVSFRDDEPILFGPRENLPPYMQQLAELPAGEASVTRFFEASSARERKLGGLFLVNARPDSWTPQSKG